MQVWSNDKYEKHRATVNSDEERFSIPYFINSTHSTMVEPVDEFIDDERPAKYKAGGSFSHDKHLVISRSLMSKTSRSKAST